MATEATTAAEIQALITDPDVEVSYGAQLLDEYDVYIADISEDFKGGTVDWDNDALIHGHAMFYIAENETTGDILLGYDWEDVRIRPYQTLTSADYYKTWYKGVYALTEPMVQLGTEAPLVYEVEGYTKEVLLDRPTGESVVAGSVTAGSIVSVGQYLYTAYAAINSQTPYSLAFNDGPMTAEVTGCGTQFDPTEINTPFDIGAASGGEAYWLYDPDNPLTWLGIVEDCLEGVGYNKLYTDIESGLFTSEPYVSPSNLPHIWTFDLADEDTQIVKGDRECIRDKRDRTNWVRFIRRNMQEEPTEGAGYYTTAFNGGYHTIGGNTVYGPAYEAAVFDEFCAIHDFTSSGTFEVRGGPIHGAEILIVGGGGGGSGGGGGAGEYIHIEDFTLVEGSYAVVVGAGGAGHVSDGAGEAVGANGSDSTFYGLTALGGGGGGLSDAVPATSAGQAGGSGGGAGSCSGGQNAGGASTASDGVGFAGGDNGNYTAARYPAGGGGGAYAVGNDAPNVNTGGNGGSGYYNDITATNTQYAGGGGGGVYNAGGTGGSGVYGGGNGGSGAAGSNGTANRGGGGGGAGNTFSGGNGGSGRVVIRYPAEAQWKQTIMMEAASQTDLETMAAAYVEKLQGKNQVVTIQTGPWPIAGHRDVVKLIDAAADIDSKCSVLRWSIPLDGESPVELELQVID